MAQFFDANQNAWNININVRKLKGIRETVRDKDGRPVDLMEMVNDRLAFTLIQDPVLTADILWYLCKDQAASLNASQETFYDSLWGEKLENATAALVEALSDFFPKSEAETLKEIIAAVGQIQKAARGQMVSQMKESAAEIQSEQMAQKLRENRDRKLDEISGS